MSVINCFTFLFFNFLHLIFGVISIIPTFLILVVGSIITATIWLIPDFIYTVWSIYTTKRWGPNIKLLILLIIPIALILWLPLVLIVSSLLGIFYGFFGPLIHFTIGLFDNQNIKSICFGGNIIKVIKYSKNAIIDFWNINKSYKSLLKDFRDISTGPVFDIPLYKLPIAFLIVLFCGICNSITFIFICIILYFPLTIRSYIYLIKFMFCCSENDIIIQLLSCFCFIPNIILLFLIPIFGIILIILSPFYGFFGGLKAALYSYNSNNLMNSIYYNNQFINAFWYKILSFATKKNYNYDSSHLDATHSTDDITIMSHNQTTSLSYQNNIIINEERVSMEYIWENFFNMCKIYTINALNEKLIEKEDIESLEPYLFIGIPSFLVFRLIYRSRNNSNAEFQLENGKIINDNNRPNNFLANSVWIKLIELHKEIKELKLNENEKKFIEVFLISINNEERIHRIISEESIVQIERLEQIKILASHFQYLGTIISRMLAVSRRFGEALNDSILITV